MPIDEYKNEMSKVVASEALISDTLAKMQAESAKLCEENEQLNTSSEKQEFKALSDSEPAKSAHFGATTRGAAVESAQSDSSPENPELRVVTSPRARKKKRPLLFKIGLPAAACLVLALAGTGVYTQIINPAEQSSEQAYVFQQITGGASLGGGLQLGDATESPTAFVTYLQQVECSEQSLPEGLIAGHATIFNGYEVYLGYDEQRAIYYAAYQKQGEGNTGSSAGSGLSGDAMGSDTGSETWQLLYSNELDEAGFIEELKDYFSRI